MKREDISNDLMVTCVGDRRKGNNVLRGNMGSVLIAVNEDVLL
jgi:hypothetical protein